MKESTLTKNNTNSPSGKLVGLKNRTLKWRALNPVQFFNKKGTFAFLDALYLAFGIIVTAVFIILFRNIPENVYRMNINTADFENYILSERMHSKISYYDEDVGRLYNGMLAEKNDFRKNLAETPFELGEEQIAFRLALEGEEVYINKGFYDIAEPLAPVRYKKTEHSRPFIIINERAVRPVTIEQVFK